MMRVSAGDMGLLQMGLSAAMPDIEVVVIVGVSSSS